MANDALIHVTATFMDFEGEESQCKFYLSIDDTKTVVDIQSDVDTQVSYLNALTNCSLVQWTWAKEVFGSRVPPTMPVGQHYINSEEKLLLNQAANNGNAVRLMIPAPKDTTLETDTETYKPASDPLLTFLTIDWYSVGVNGSYVCDNDGTKLIETNFGYRKRTRSRKEKPGRSTAIG